ncbi:hypothetical protein [Sulfitobacter sp.]|uniref:hypothetical protein n=1 Tax=Sulfitobacter sp. TaxID=1903071 RepID=UPI00329A2EAE
MQPLVITVILLAVAVLLFKRGAPSRAFAREHIEPLEAKIPPIKRELTRLRNKKSALDFELSLFDRDFRAETAAQHERKRLGHLKIKALQAKINSAYADLNTAKTELDNWYSWANGSIIGNGGKKLKKSAFFSQSTDERDSLKSERDNASARIDTLKAEKNDVYKIEIEGSKQRLKTIAANRSKLKSFRSSGRTVSMIQNEILLIQESIDSAQNDLEKLEMSIRRKWRDFKTTSD